MTKEELIWIATVFDCEGNITLQKLNYTKKDGTISHYNYPIAQIAHCSLDLITRFHTLVGFGTRYDYVNKSYKYTYTKKSGEISNYQYTNRKPVYWWKAWKDDAHKFIALIWDEWISDYRRETAIKLGVDPMAKHPHKLILIDKKTWRCTLPGCNFFVHLGLAHVLVGKVGICWKCNEQYIIDHVALESEMPECPSCRSGVLVSSDLNDFIELQLKKAKQQKREAQKQADDEITAVAEKQQEEEDQIEVYDDDI